MKLWVDKELFEWAKEAQDEGRTRKIPFTTFPTFPPGSTREIEVEVRC